MKPGLRFWRHHGTVVAYVALLVAFAGTSFAAGSLVRAVSASHKPSVKITCKATRARKKVACKVVGTARGKTRPRGPRGAAGFSGETSTTLITPNTYLLFRVHVVDTQSIATMTGALAQLGRVTATYSP